MKRKQEHPVKMGNQSAAGNTMDGPSSPGPGTGLGLCDMPDPWMQQLAQVADSPSILALMRTCRPMRSLALTERPSYVRLPLAFVQSEAAALIDKLQLACKYASKVHLRLTWRPAVQGVQGNPESYGYHLMYGAGAALALAAGAGGTMPLTGIINVELQDMDLDRLVPSWLTLTCPNMTELRLSWCRLGELAPPTGAIHQCSQLQHLQMMDCTAQPALVPNWQHALRALPSLTQLHSDTTDNDQFDLPTLQMCSAVGAQLTSLRIWADDFDDEAATVRCQREVQQLAAWFPSLRDLRLLVSIIDDAVMTALLTLFPGSLQRFQCHKFLLEQSYAGSRSPWVNLHVDEVSVNQFSKLPWEGVASVSSGSLSLDAATADVAAANRVVTAIALCGGINWNLEEATTPALILADGTDSVSLAAALPLLRGSPALRLTIHGGTGLTDTFLDALHLHLPRFLNSLSFKTCTWTPGVLRHLLPCLPASVRTVLFLSPLTMAQAITICASAVRPVTLKLRVQPHTLAAEWRVQLTGVMQEAGHKHVQLMFI